MKCSMTADPHITELLHLQSLFLLWVKGYHYFQKQIRCRETALGMMPQDQEISYV